ncbi:MAG TPA: endonuclease MutS2 [bacterium]|nr:endonuclease MutS2 [bacterium]
MDTHTLRTLEYDKVLSLIARYASSDPGRESVLALEPLSDLSQMKRHLKMVSEMRSLLEWGRVPPLSGALDTRDAVLRAKTAGAVLEARTLLAVGQTASVARLARRFFLDNRELAPLIRELADRLVELRTLEDSIDAAIDEDTNIKDSASARLARIRQEKTKATARIASTLQRILARESLGQHLQESLITIRSGRYVVPVRAEAKSDIPGIVHDTSQSGATVFIEPMETVQLNNALRSLELEEKNEILKILCALTQAVGQAAETLIANMETLFELDALLAAARFSIEFGCTEPILSSDGQIALRGGKHPILIETQRARGDGGVVPLDLAIGPEKRGLIITGPNAGGKTVALKTLGVLTLLARAGLHVPSGDGTVIAPFREISVDIGDEQSIELSLSTFSSHMRKIIKVLEGAGKDSLVLLDEIGAGTDPAEGTALARAIIEELLLKGATLVVTTHHMDLKVLAHDNPLLENASMEFDSRNLRPTYRLIQGVPGASHALEIAARLGLEPSTLQRARAYCGGERIKLEDLSRDLLERIRRIEEQEAAAEAKRRKADQVLDEYERKLSEIKNREKDMRKQALKEARSIVDDARRTAQAVVRDLKDLGARKAEPQAAQSLEKQMKQEVSKLSEAIDQLEGPAPSRVPLRNASVGARAYIKPLAAEGVLLRAPDDRGRVEVAVGPLRVEVGSDDLFEPAVSGPPAKPMGVRFEAKVVPAEVDIRGMTAEDAWEFVDKYVDDAALCGLPFVRIIHGKGKGVLARRLNEMLAAHPRVKTHRFGDAGEGGTGVTVIEIERE